MKPNLHINWFNSSNLYIKYIKRNLNNQSGGRVKVPYPTAMFASSDSDMTYVAIPRSYLLAVKYTVGVFLLAENCAGESKMGCIFEIRPRNANGTSRHRGVLQIC